MMSGTETENKASWRNYFSLALVTTLLLLVHLLLQHEPLKRRSVRSATEPWAVDPIPTVLTHSTTRPLPIAQITKKKVVMSLDYMAAAKYVPGHKRSHSELCPRLGARILVVVMVISSPPNVALRQAIRLTWGAAVAKLNFTLAFVLGQPEPKLKTSLELEDETYGDLIFGNFYDSYKNLTIKSLSMIEWMNSYCPRAAFLFKTDDDVFLNVGLLQKFAVFRLNETRCIWGYLNRRSFPYRSSKKRYHVPVIEYPGRRFPKFVSGLGYLITGDSISPMLEVAKKMRFVSMEDVFVTGVVAAKVGVRRVHSVRFVNRGHSLPPPCELRELVVIHEARPRDHMELWWKLHDPEVKCDENRTLSFYRGMFN